MKPEFQLRKLNQIKGKNPFYALIKDGECEFDRFCEKMNNSDQYQSELKSIFANMDLVANQISLPKTKFRDITPAKEPIKEHEFKTKNLRVYAFQEKGTGKIIVCGGTKGTQKSDIRHFRQLKKQYLNTTT